MYDDISVGNRQRELGAAEIFDEALVDRLPLGVVVLDHHGYVVKYNRYEEGLARRRRQDVIGRMFFSDVARCTDNPQVAGVFRRGMEEGQLSAEVETTFELPFHPKPRDVRILMQSFELGQQPFGVLLIEDVTLRRDLERERERLLSMLVHDLKNPLQGIVGYVNLLQVGAYGEIPRQEQKEALAAIETSSLRLRDLLDTSLDELSGRKKRPGLVNLHALLLSSLGSALPEARRLRLRISYRGQPFERAEFPNQAFPVLGQVEQLARLVDNLVSNAIKYARTQIDLRLEQRGEHFCVEVQDDGPGIAAEFQEKIFQPGYQIPGSRPGHGLGLAGTQQIAQDHQGRIELESKPGEGSVFRVLLPVHTG